LDILRAATVIAGDFNDNGAVDAADYVVWREGLGATYTQNDYDVWRRNFGKTVSAGAASYAQFLITEPASGLLFAATTAVAWMQRRRLCWL
jgi:hypothetical protein